MTDHRYRAFGLDLVSEVELPGLGELDAPAAAAVTIRLADRATLERRWSGPSGAPVWHSHTDHARAVTGELGVAGDFLLSCDGEGAYLLAPDRRSLLCAPVQLNGGAWRRFLLDTALVSTALLHGFTALHASAVKGPEWAVGFVSEEGGGKTTIAAELLRRGYGLVADDVSVVAPALGGHVVHPGPGVMNVSGSTFWGARAIGRTLGLFGEEVWVEVASAAPAPVPLAALVLIERREGAELACAHCPGSALDLLPHARGFNFTPTDGLQAFTRMSDLAASVPLYRLSGDPTHAAAELADAVEEALLGDAGATLEAAP